MFAQINPQLSWQLRNLKQGRNLKRGIPKSRDQLVLPLEGTPVGSFSLCPRPAPPPPPAARSSAAAAPPCPRRRPPPPARFLDSRRSRRSPGRPAAPGRSSRGTRTSGRPAGGERTLVEWAGKSTNCVTTRAEPQRPKPCKVEPPKTCSPHIKRGFQLVSQRLDKPRVILLAWT